MYSPHVVNTNDFSSQFRTNIDSAHNGPLKSGSAECDVKRILVTDWSAGIWIQIAFTVLNEIQSEDYKKIPQYQSIKVKVNIMKIVKVI